MPINSRSSRYYVHGDQHEKNPDTYYCAQCDSFSPLKHFDDVSHVASRADRYQQSLKAWKFHALRSRNRFYRPANAHNVIAKTATEDLADVKASRSTFYRWLLRQTERDDPIGDLANDTQKDKSFPISTNDVDRLRLHLLRRHATSEAIVALDEAWKAFKSKRKLRVGLTVTQRFSIFKRDQYRCQICGKSAQDGISLEVDHKNPVAKGGSNEPKNLWTLCGDCNRGKSDNEL